MEVPQPNNRVTLRYTDGERRCEQMTGGVPPWTWAELGPMVRDLDAVYVNFISGFELELETAQFLRRGFDRFLYADLHSLFLAKEPDGTRVPRALPDAPAWFGCFDVVQLNEDELAQLGPDPLVVAAGGHRGLLGGRGGGLGIGGAGLVAGTAGGGDHRQGEQQGGKAHAGVQPGTGRRAV